MGGKGVNVLVAQRSGSDTHSSAQAAGSLPFFRRRAAPTVSVSWKPLALRAPVLVLTILLSWTIIAVLQIFLIQSQRNQGIIFAPQISDLPLGRTFLYLYFPTVVAVIFSMYWAWIDLETKRMEPYYQLSKEDGALGKDSLLLQYPFDFIPLVPMKAFRDKHWPVFWASFAVVLVTWGLVPTQAGIFSVKTVTRSIELPFARSTAFISAQEQATNLTMRFSQSTYAIATLNETLTNYMGRNYTLAPFRPAGEDSESSEFWTSPTTMYSVDLWCERAVLSRSSSVRGLIANSSNGCSFRSGLDGNQTIDKTIGYQGSTVLRTKEYTSMYVGYWNPLGFSDYSLDASACPIVSNNTFYAAFQRNKIQETDPVQNVTAIYCWPTYYQQEVIATVDVTTLAPVKIEFVGSKSPLAKDLFNSTRFETLLTSGSLGTEVRSDILPIKQSPDYFDSIAHTNISLTSGPNGAGFIEPMAGLAHAVSDLPPEQYLDWQTLAKSYADAYRLIFARAMKDILIKDFQSAGNISGKVEDTTEAVVLEPVFVYIVEGFLAVVSIATMALLYLSLTRTKNLRSNPSTIAAIMAMVADNESLLSDVEGLDCCTMDGIKDHMGHKRYKLVDDGAGVGITEITSSTSTVLSDPQRIATLVRSDTFTDIAKPVRPLEFRLSVAFPFVGLFIALAITLTVIFVKAHLQGLPLPSKNTIVQNILENYIPTALATLIEPAWILINRLLCMLQPLEELQNCKAKAKDSINLNYGSLPPQLVVFKALKAKHFVLAAVCTMGLLANLLAVTFAGLFNQDTIDMRHPMTLHPPFTSKFVSINGTTGPIGGQDFGALEPSGAYQGGNGQGQFLIADAFLRNGIPLPAWTDESMFYLPSFDKNNNSVTFNHVEAKTRAFGAKLECTSLTFDDRFQAAIVQPDPDRNVTYPSTNITITGPDGRDVRCTKTGFYIQNGPVSTEEGSCVKGPSAVEFVFVVEPTANASQADAEVCMGSVVLGWHHNPNGVCEGPRTVTMNEQISAFVHCRPKILTGLATVRVDATGRVQGKVQDLKTSTIEDTSTGEFFSNDAINLIGQSNRYLFKVDSPQWHNDSFSNDFINYFAAHVMNSTRLLDPTQDIPSMKDIEAPINRAYSLLFAIWLGTNKDKLLVPYTSGTSPALSAFRIEREKRLFVSTPMFAISLSILCIYAIVAIVVYMRRPGQYLARMPTSIASVIALFAASAAVQDMQGTSHLDRKGRARHLDQVDARYGYGSFIGGGDGRVHIGIEKTPFVRVRAKSTWFEKKVKSWRKGSV